MARTYVIVYRYKDGRDVSVEVIASSAKQARDGWHRRFPDVEITSVTRSKGGA